MQPEMMSVNSLRLKTEGVVFFFVKTVKPDAIKDSY